MSIETLYPHAVEIINWLVRLGALVIVPFRRPASEARGWLLLFFIVPIAALILYLIIGRPSHPAARKQRFAELPAMLARVSERTGTAADSLLAELPGELASTARLANALCQLPALTGNKVDLRSDYQAFIDELVAEIDKAERHVHLEYYIFKADRTGVRVMEALARAAARGITCRVLIDALGSFGSARAVEKRLIRVGVDVRHILPLRRRWSSSRIDLRNHRKIAVIDGRIGYVGSQNIVDQESSPGWPNEELSARVEGPIVGELQAVFLADWFLETGEDLSQDHLFAKAREAGPVSAQLLPTGPDYPGGGVDLLFVQMLHLAEREVVITTPYFIPNDALTNAMRAAVLRGVAVTLIFPRHSDNWIVGLAQRSYYDELLRIGVSILLYEPGFLHSKHMRVDDALAVIGSCNMDLRSFELNAEISLILFGARVAADLKTVENMYRDQSTPLDKQRWRERLLPIKVAENCARLFSDLI